MTDSQFAHVTDEQREKILARLDDVAGSIIALVGALGGLNELGVWAGGVKAESWLNGIIYSIPAFVMAIAVLFAYQAKFTQWLDAQPDSFVKVFEKKNRACHWARIVAVIGAFLFFLAILVYVTRGLFAF